MLQPIYLRDGGGAAAVRRRCGDAGSNVLPYARPRDRYAKREGVREGRVGCQMQKGGGYEGNGEITFLASWIRSGYAYRRLRDIGAF